MTFRKGIKKQEHSESSAAVLLTATIREIRCTSLARTSSNGRDEDVRVCVRVCLWDDERGEQGESGRVSPQGTQWKSNFRVSRSFPKASFFFPEARPESAFFIEWSQLFGLLVVCVVQSLLLYVFVLAKGQWQPYFIYSILDRKHGEFLLGIHVTLFLVFLPSLFSAHGWLQLH